MGLTRIFRKEKEHTLGFNHSLSSKRAFTLLCGGFICLLCASCVVAPIPMRKRTIGPTGIEAKTVDLSFIQVGATSREEVFETLGWIDTGLQNERVFLGRWTGSSHGWVWAVGGGLSGAAGAERVWGEKNLLLEFDQDSIVKEFRVVKDKSLLKELSAWSTLGVFPPLSRPLTIYITHRHGKGGDLPGATLTLGEDFVEFEEVGGASHNFRISPEKVTRVSRAGPWSQSPRDSKYFFLTIHFEQKTKAGKKILIGLDLPTLTTLVSYFDHTRPKVVR